eukprot:gene12097-16189_t
MDDSYYIGGLLSSNSFGSYGVVVNAIRYRENGDEKEVVMKFFGYTYCEPAIAWIDCEINNLTILQDLEGVCRFETAFEDSLEGYISNIPAIPDDIRRKKFLKKYPVIVMEKLRGGELLDRINNESFSEAKAIKIFKTFIETLQKMHDEKNMVHCDLKVENLVFPNATDLDNVKIIDFGQSIILNNGIKIEPAYRVKNMENPTFHTTLQYIAPETIPLAKKSGWATYSRASDIWQTACILYIMLVGDIPFAGKDDNNEELKHNIENQIFTCPLDNLVLSPEAIALLKRLFDPNPDSRITCVEILNDPWITQQNPPTIDLGEARRIGLTQLKTMKLFRRYIENSGSTSKKRKSSIIDYENKKPSSPISPASPISNLRLKRDTILQLKQQFLKALNLTTANNNDLSMTNSEIILDVNMMNNLLAHNGINFETFRTVLNGVENLSMLCSEQIFALFDWDGNGTVDYFEFLLTFSRFLSDEDWNDRHTLARVYFDVFNVSRNIDSTEECIHVEILKRILTKVMPELIATDITNSSNINEEVDRIVASIDQNHDGIISLSEFQSYIDDVYKYQSKGKSFN